LASRAGHDAQDAQSKYRTALENGVLKILSKMGVCTIDAYRGSQLFEILGLHTSLTDAYFPATAAIGGSVTLDQLAEEVCTRHAHAHRATSDALSHPGFHGFRNGGDHHVFNPTLVRAFHQSAGSRTPEAYTRFSSLVHSRPPTAIRDLLTFVPQTGVPLEEVEPIDSICTRFFASAMSVGALGPEAHRTLAIALNRLGGRSNSGEGGEDRDRYARDANGLWANSVTKQVASARFGVTPAYLISARELQIKMAQGSKPGEGGQLPAQKVVDHIARLRHARPGTPLISPPPHHDIYSIEDLAQLIYDLRAFHPRARINVKLVSTTGVGVIAAGVVKAGADAIQISGHSGGTGASPRGSIKHAGLPWEIGLVEAHRVLSARGVRHRVVLQTDGGLVTGHDIVMAAALGADEYGFGTAALVALGCVMARQCHLNTCPVGIATQRSDLRAKFDGTPEQVIAYLRMVAAETREIMSRLGVRSLRELVGRSDLIAARPDVANPGVDVAALLTPAPRTVAAIDPRVATDVPLNARLVRRAGNNLGRQPVTVTARVRNTDRTVGAGLMGVIAQQSGDLGIPLTPLRIVLNGDAGQSVGAFMLPGVSLSLRGTANDGVAKGMHGGHIAIRPYTTNHVVSAGNDNVLIGNAALYGATGGRLFVAGRAGERFAVRNSGAVAVVEGVGHHGCEYMTGGSVVILGDTGANFGAGMTGGAAYVYDAARTLKSRINRADVVIMPLARDLAESIKALVAEHHAATGSAIAATVLDNWSVTVRAFRAVLPREGIAHVSESPAVAAAARNVVRLDPRIAVAGTADVVPI
jgi:glutamate synthase domain-containing protein 2/glutamate synthase domain-containing protein 3